MQLTGKGIAAGCLIALASPLAQGGSNDKVCGRVCRQTFKTLRFSDVPSELAPPFRECSSPLYQQGLFLCWGIHCSTEARLAESRSMNQSCQALIGSRLPPYSIVDDFTEEEIARLRRFNATSPDRKQLLGQPVLPSRDFYELWARTLDVTDYAHYYHYYYGWAMGIFWALIVTIGVANRMLLHLEASTTRFFFSQSRIVPWVRRKILVPATFGQRCVQDIGGLGTVPPRVQTATVALFVAMNVAFSVCGYKFFEGNMYYPSISMQVLRHVSDRTGIISFANFPLIWLFGMRNNFAMWLTGWHFGTYNNFHRWVARVATVQAIVHSVGYTALILQKGGWEYFWRLWSLMFWWTGELATVFMTFLVLFSAFCIRRRNYEVFLVVHVALSFLILATMLGHVRIFKGAYDALVWVPAFVWLLDRILRGIRILGFNPVFWKTNAAVTYNEQANIIRLVVPFSSSFYNIKPGTFYYVMVLNRWNFWESHPFTVAAVSPNDRCAAPPHETSPLLEREPLSPDEAGQHPEKQTKEMTFLIRPYDSFTSRLKQYAESNWPKSALVNVAIDGPYGGSLPLERFHSVLFIVGGSGIAVASSYLKKLIASAEKPERVHIHWAVQHPALATNVLDNELRDALGSKRVRVNVYVTRAPSEPLSDEARCRDVAWKAGRMKIEEVIEASLNKEVTESLAVVACGPPRMADDCRRAVVAQMVPHRPHVEYFEESFQW